MSRLEFFVSNFEEWRATWFHSDVLPWWRKAARQDAIYALLRLLRLDNLAKKYLESIL